MGVNPITYADIDAWARLTGRQPTPFEVSVITRLDDALLAKPVEEKKPVTVNARDGQAVSALLQGFRKAGDS